MKKFKVEIVLILTACFLPILIFSQPVSKSKLILEMIPPEPFPVYIDTVGNSNIANTHDVIREFLEINGNDYRFRILKRDTLKVDTLSGSYPGYLKLKYFEKWLIKTSVPKPILQDDLDLRIGQVVNTAKFINTGSRGSEKWEEEIVDLFGESNQTKTFNLILTSTPPGTSFFLIPNGAWKNRADFWLEKTKRYSTSLQESAGELINLFNNNEVLFGETVEDMNLEKVYKYWLLAWANGVLIKQMKLDLTQAPRNVIEISLDEN